MTIEWTPKEKRSRDKWRNRGGLANIQIKNGLSREELADFFRLQAEATLNGYNSIEDYLMHKSESERIGVNNTQFYQLAKQFGQLKD